MIVRVWVTLKPGVPDPQGIAIQRALAAMGYAPVRQVRQGKCFEIDWDGVPAQARERIEAIASGVLSNPVIEDYRIEWPEPRS